MAKQRTKTDYIEIWALHKTGKSKREIAGKVGCTVEHVRQIIAHFSVYEDHYGKKEGLAAYQPRELMAHLAALGYRGKLQYLQEIDITKL